MRLTNWDQAMQWILSKQGIICLKELWYSVHGYWENKKNLAKFVQGAKNYFGIDFQDYTQDGCIGRLLLHHLGQRRKTVSNAMNELHGLTLQKSSKKHKVPGKKWSVKREKGVFNELFIHFRDGNASKIKFNGWCDKEGMEDKYKWDIEEVDTSSKVIPNVGNLQVLHACCEHSMTI